MKIILFESVDKVGKTLIIQKMKEVIKQNNKIPIIFTVPYEIECKNSNDTTERLKLSNILLDKMINRYNDNYICLIDGHHISEMAYGNKLRDGYNTETCKAIDFFLSAYSTLLIQIRPDDILKNFDKFKNKDNKLDGFSKRDYISLLHNFAIICEESSLEKICIKTSEINTENILKILERIGGLNVQR